MNLNELTSKLMSYESGDLPEDEIYELFQHLINTGMAWQLQGSYGRTAKMLLDMGLIIDPDSRDAVLPDNISTVKPGVVGKK